ncbi:YggT family protein [Sporolactobacillus sp. Y61]|uniref:YggT family protein n=1 Tax=Sporolactobacillus sp. Y61 TaxID=3160863 RepID=A0AAU8ICQ6_9BACL|nr:YggT family protein [Sporolactobacillus sp. THM19-2]
MVLFAEILTKLINIYSWLLIIYIFMSWVPSVQNSSIGQILARICEPFLAPFRKIIPPIGGMIDISPIIAFFVLQMATRGIWSLALMISG